MKSAIAAELALLAIVTQPGAVTRRSQVITADPSSYVDTRIGTANGGNTFPGAVLPFGMVQWSPETTRGDATRPSAPGGYAYDTSRVRGFSLTHLSGTGCRGASGDIPFMPIPAVVKTSPSSDSDDRTYAARFSHVNETAVPGYYQVRFENGVNVELGATDRTGVGRFTFPADGPASLLVRVSDSEVGSSDAHVEIDREHRTIAGSVTSGNFCGYLNEIDRRSYYTLHFVAVFDRPFSGIGTWHDATLTAGSASASGATTYGTDGYPVKGKGAGAFVTFETASSATVDVRIGISYVSAANARANLDRESPAGTSVDTVRARARDEWNRALSAIQIRGGTERERRIFYTALYHALLHPNLFSDADGEYTGFDSTPHRVSGKQRAQYANFSGWDVYRSQLQLVALLNSDVASDIAQSLFNQSEQNNGEWDRWTHNSGATHVMEGDPSPPSIAGMYAFGATGFDVKAAYASLVRAATVPTPADSSKDGCPVECAGQRPSLDKWLSIHYIPTVSNAWGGAGETLEDAVADFSLAQLAHRLGDVEHERLFLQRSGYWRNLLNDRGFIQDRNEDGSWPAFDPASSDGFAEGSSAQYTWMVPHDPRGLFDAMGATQAAMRRLDAFFHNADGTLALTRLGGLHAEMDNEPSTAAVWLFLYGGQPAKTHETVRAAMTTLWSDAPYGIPGNDDLGAMSAWYVWSAVGLYPGIPGRAELLVGSPLFPEVTIRHLGGDIVIHASGARADAMFVRSLDVNGRRSTHTWLPESFAEKGGTLAFQLASTADKSWGAATSDAPPSFAPR